MTLSKEKFEHILAYAKQQQKLGVHHCNILPDDMVAIMEMAAGKLERRERDKQEPVYQVQYGQQWRDVSRERYNDHVEHGSQVRIVYAAPPAPVFPDNRAITQYFDTLALDNARDIMCDVNRRHELLGGDVQLLARIQCRIDEVCRVVMLQSFGNSEQLNSPVAPDGWISVCDQMPDQKSERRVCVFTPTPHEDMRYRFVPASLFKAVCSSATHWYYIEPPSAPKQEPNQ